MIVVKLFGGLGNQMFQYAAGRRLAYIYNTELKFDFQGLNGVIKRNYELGVFNIRENFATPREIGGLKFKKRTFFSKVIAKIFDIRAEYTSAYIKEKYFHFDPTILNLPDGVYLDGYWQSEKYFKDIEKIISSEFTIKIPQVGRNKELSDIVNSCESVSIHIRRGDYVLNPEINAYYESCGLGHYHTCINAISQRTKSPVFFIFSDEPQWVKETLKINYPSVIVDYNKPDSAFEDLRLMSQCKHNIIANSSFSWWGAWLNPNPNKIVFAPKKWFRNNALNVIDLIPSGWLKI